MFLYNKNKYTHTQIYKYIYKVTQISNVWPGDETYTHCSFYIYIKSIYIYIYIYYTCVNACVSVCARVCSEVVCVYIPIVQRNTSDQYGVVWYAFIFVLK